MPLFNRRDPWWQAEGPAARREHRRHLMLSSAAFAAGLTAVAFAIVAWSIEVGLAGAFGVYRMLAAG